MEPQQAPECSNCGAACNPGLTACSYCETAFPGAPDGVSCPGCGDDNRPHLTLCVTCGHTLMWSCIFCGSSSSIVMPSCHRCGEALVGAEERKKQRDEQQRQQQMMGLASTGISMLGQVASSPVGQNLLGQVWNELVNDKKR